MTQSTVTSQLVCTQCDVRSSALTEILAWARLQMRRRRTRHQLAALPDYLLRDLGLTRYDVTREISRPFWR